MRISVLCKQLALYSIDTHLLQYRLPIHKQHANLSVSSTRINKFLTNAKLQSEFFIVLSVSMCLILKKFDMGVSNAEVKNGEKGVEKPIATEICCMQENKTRVTFFELHGFLFSWRPDGLERYPKFHIRPLTATTCGRQGYRDCWPGSSSRFSWSGRCR